MSIEDTPADVGHLEAFDTDELIDELRRRHTTFHFIGRPIADRDYDYRHSWSGVSLIDLLGLIEFGKLRIEREWIEQDGGDE